MTDHLISLRNRSNPAIQSIQVKWCESFLSKLSGYTFRRNLNWDEGLLLVDPHESRMDTAIHMMFVWTDLTVVWIDSFNLVVDTVLAKSWRPFYAPSQPARYVLEIHPGRFGEFKAGDIVDFDHA